MSWCQLSSSFLLSLLHGRTLHSHAGILRARLIGGAVYESPHLVVTGRRGGIDSHQPDAGTVQAHFGKARVAGLHPTRNAPNFLACSASRFCCFFL